ncbi:MAG TPA: PAS domain-containing protein, partial [Acidimicrobiales bacterium]|nr:PAS domain-containing protein [Acidimicrobiales bacterium]
MGGDLTASEPVRDALAELESLRNDRLEDAVRFDLVLDAMPDAVVLVDDRGVITRANAGAGRLAGLEASALVGRTLASLLGERAPATPMQLFERAPEGRFTFDAAVESAADRPPVPVSVSCCLLRDTSARVVGAVYVARDLSETRLLVSRLEQAEARWRLIAQLGDEAPPRLGLLEAADQQARLAQV